jgi:alkylation response protein AidB-like acyl-CoA dehydrogenase
MTNWNAMSDEEFRQIARKFIEDNYPQNLRYPSKRLRWAEIKDWYFTQSKAGWIAPGWPVEYGGMGLSPGKLIIWVEDQENYGVGRAPDHGLTMIGPTIIQLGSPEQKAHYLPKIITGEHVWGQCYSEPNAGSDLASLRTEAVLDGDHFVVNGQKIWSTLAQDATHLYVLVRTDKNVKKQEGITFLLVDAKTPGITIRPIMTIAGDDKFCEVFFDNVRVPAANVIGGVNKGWTVAKTQLGFERIFLGSPKLPQYALGRLEDIAMKIGAFDDALFTDKFTQLKLDVADLNALYRRYTEIVRRGGKLPPDVSMLKIWSTETYSRIAGLMVEAAGGAGGLDGATDIGGMTEDIMTHYYYARPATIYGGSNEVQRNILSQSTLNLPR